MGVPYRFGFAILACCGSFWVGFRWGYDSPDNQVQNRCRSVNAPSVYQPQIRRKSCTNANNLPDQLNSVAKNCPPAVLDHLIFNDNEGASVLDVIFNSLHHPAPMNKVKSETILASHKINNMSDCKEIYLTRSGSRPNMPNKCVAIVSAHKTDVSPYRISHRVGTSAGITNRYASDMHTDHTDKNDMPKLFMRDRQKLVDLFLQKMGDPIDKETGEKRVAFVMLANAGMLDLLVNFMCSTRAAGINLKDTIIFVGDDSSGTVVESMGLKYFFHPSVGSMPKKAANFYGDDTFTNMMWLKVTAVYVAAAAGFDVLFQVI